MCGVFTSRPSVSLKRSSASLSSGSGGVSVMGPHDHFQEIQRDFYHAYGLAMSGWAEIENSFAAIFVTMTQIPAKTGRAIFYSAHSFVGRQDMFLAAVDHAKVVPDGREFLRGAMRHAREWSATRNTLAHEMHRVSPSEEPPIPKVEISSRHGSKIGTTQLETAAVNFFRFGQMLNRSQGRKLLVREPELCRELLRKLPKDALNNAEDPNGLSLLLTRIGACPD